MVDVTILTDKRYVNPTEIDEYVQNILDEYEYLREALIKKEITVARTNWDNPEYDWTQTKAVVFRTVWDYFERYQEFKEWMQRVSKLTQFINPLSLIEWNIDKHYLQDLEEKGVQIVPTHFVDSNDYQSLKQVCTLRNWKDIVVKPAIAGGAFHTYKIMSNELDKNEGLFKNLVEEHDMLVQEYQTTITTKGEASLMVFNGQYTHAILKKAKKGDFRVQDDFGGTVHNYTPTKEEIAFAEKVFACCNPKPAYGRADIIWDEQGNPYLSELEIIEPELWVRNYPESATLFAEGILNYL